MASTKNTQIEKRFEQKYWELAKAVRNRAKRYRQGRLSFRKFAGKTEEK